MRIDFELKKRLLEGAGRVKAEGFCLPPLQVNHTDQWSRRAVLSGINNIDGACRTGNGCQLAQVNVKDHVGRIVALDRIVWNSADPGSIGETIGRDGNHIEKYEGRGLTGEERRPA